MGRSANKFKFIGAVAVLLQKDDEVLLMKRANTGFGDGMYSLPSGHVDGGESFKEATVREAKEELGIDISEDGLELFHVSQHVYGPTHECITFFFKTDSWQGKPTNNEPNKCSDLRWFKKDALPDDLILNIKDAIENHEGQVSLQCYPLNTDKNMEDLTKQKINKPSVK